MSLASTGVGGGGWGRRSGSGDRSPGLGSGIGVRGRAWSPARGRSGLAPRGPGGQLLSPSMASPAAAAHGETEERDLPAASIAPTSSAGRELPGSPLTSGSCPLARGQLSRGRGVAVETRASAAVCESIGRARRAGWLAYGPFQKQT